MTEPAAMTEQEVWALESWARLRYDPIRDRWVLLAPERVLFPCPTTVTILQRLDGSKRLGVLMDELAHEFEAPREVIARDTMALLSDLRAQRLLARTDGAG